MKALHSRALWVKAGLAPPLVVVLLVGVGVVWFAPRSGPREVVIPLSGRLGNQLFQLAAGDAIRKQTHATPVFVENAYADDTQYRVSVFARSRVFVSAEAACSGGAPADAPPVGTDCAGLAAALQTRKPCLRVTALFQCHRVAAVGLPAVRAALERLPQAAKAAVTVGKLRRANRNRALVALHVRRGDYTKRFNRNLLEPIPVAYYVEAMRLMPSDSVFLVFSDDLVWSREAFRQDMETGRTVIFMDLKDPIEALLTIAKMDHQIVANSTFSWWGAFLNEYRKKTVIAPTPWFGPRMKTPTDLVPHEWIQLDYRVLNGTVTRMGTAKKTHAI